MAVEFSYVALANLLHTRGYDVCVVGGAVRDSMQGNPIVSVDLATNASQAELKEVFFGKKMTFKGRFLTEIEGITLISFFFKDYKNGTVTYEPTNSMDVFIRSLDFTISAMVKTVMGDLYDPHNGVRDISKRLVRTVSDPDLLFSSEPFMIFKALFLAAKTGFSLDAECERAIRANLHLLSTSDRPKLGELMSKILVRQTFSRFLDLLNQYGLTYMLYEGYENLSSLYPPDCTDHLDVSAVTKSLLRLMEDKSNPGLLLAAFYLYSGLVNPLDSEVPVKFEGMHSYQMASAQYAKRIMSELNLDHSLIDYVVYLITFKGLFFGGSLTHTDIISGLHLLKPFYSEQRALTKMVGVLFTFNSNFCRLSDSQRYKDDKGVFSENRNIVSLEIRKLYND